MFLAKAVCNDTIVDTERDREMEKHSFAFKKITI